MKVGWRLTACTACLSVMNAALTTRSLALRAPVTEDQDDERFRPELAAAAGVEQRLDQLPRLAGGVVRPQPPFRRRVVERRAAAVFEVVGLISILTPSRPVHAAALTRQESVGARVVHAPQQRADRNGGDCADDRIQRLQAGQARGPV